MYKAVIFDFDGVILDSEGYHYLAWKEVLKRYFDLEESFYVTIKSMGRRAILEAAANHYNVHISEEEKDQLLADKAVVYKRIAGVFTEKNLVKGIKEYLERIHDKVKIGLATSSTLYHDYLVQFDLYKYFDAITDATIKAPLKPAPDIYLITARKLGVDPQDCLVYEDSLIGIQAAKNAGMHCIGIGKKEYLSKYVDEVVENFSEIKKDL